MRKLTCLLALTFATPAVAEPLTADQELECALIVAVASSQTKDANQNLGLAAMMAYWFGRYEARTGKTFNEAVTPDFVRKLVAGMDAISPRCEVEMKKVGARMQALGADMSRLSREADGK